MGKLSGAEYGIILVAIGSVLLYLSALSGVGYVLYLVAKALIKYLGN